jgi:superoxide dismutase
MAFTLAPLPYDFNALEPHIDARTMEIHHGKHHQAYVTNLNNAIAGTDAENMSIEDICKNISKFLFPCATMAEVTGIILSFGASWHLTPAEYRKEH